MQATPCMTIGKDKDIKEKTLLCMPSIGEKELWIQHFNYAKDLYK